MLELKATTDWWNTVLTSRFNKCNESYGPRIISHCVSSSPVQFQGGGCSIVWVGLHVLMINEKNSLMTVQLQSVRVRACVRNFIWHLPGCQDHVVMQTSLISNSRILCVQTPHCDYHKHLFTESTHFCNSWGVSTINPSEIRSKCAGTKMKESVQGIEEPDNLFKE